MQPYQNEKLHYELGAVPKVSRLNKHIPSPIRFYQKYFGQHLCFCSRLSNMKYHIILAAASALPYLALSSGTKCTATSNGCYLKYPSSSCKCLDTPNPYSAGVNVYPMCTCVTNGITFYADESNTWVEAHHFSCAAPITQACQSCMEAQC